MSDNNKKVDALDVVFGIAFVFIILVVSFYGWNFRGSSISDNVSNWGAFGDYVGGVVNPILAFFSFMALLITLDLQRKQLNKTEEQLELNREELKLTREELKKAADAQVDSAKVLNEQLKTQYLQQFDSLFFNLVKQFTEKIESLEKDNLIQIYYERIHKKRNAGSSWDSRGYCSILEIFYCVIERIDSAFEKQVYFSFEEKKNIKSNISKFLDR